MASYRLLTYAAGRNDARAGLLLDGNRIVDLEAALRAHGRATGKAPGFSGATTAEVIANWSKARPVLNAIARDGVRRLRSRPLSRTRLLPPLPDVRLIYCAGANYYDHAAEAGVTVEKAKVRPFFFVKAVGAQPIGPDAPILLPAWSQLVDWEAEIAVVMGRSARNVAEKDALKYVAGYMILNDLSARDHSQRDDWPFKWDWFPHKSFDTSAPMGPWITPASEIPDPHTLALNTWINDSHEQDTSSSQMIFSVEEQIAALSRQLTLRPGDIISTGTGAGVGVFQGKKLKPGDQVRVEIEGLGTLSNPVKAGA